jgi:NADPH:quinone reductase-like Zn-dependent oxidoreductase
MRAACVTGYGGPDCVVVREVPRPDPGPGQVRVRVVSTTVNSGDARMRALNVPRGLGTLMRLAMGWRVLRQPVLGFELSGCVDAVGEGVTRWRPDDAVVVMRGVSLAAHAEYVVMPADGKIVPRPKSLSFDEAAALCFGGVTALHYLHAAPALAQGGRLLVIGASGAVGSAAVQVARILGAHVTGVCSAENAELVAGLGAHRVLDYRREAFTAAGETWDAVLDCVGATPYATARPVFRPGGRFLRLVADLPGLLAAPFQGRLSGHRVVAGVSAERFEDLRDLCTWADEGRYRPVIDSVYPLERIAEAHARVDTGHKRGSVVVRVGVPPAGIS